MIYIHILNIRKELQFNCIFVEWSLQTTLCITCASIMFLSMLVLHFNVSTQTKNNTLLVLVQLLNISSVMPGWTEFSKSQLMRNFSARFVHRLDIFLLTATKSIKEQDSLWTLNIWLYLHKPLIHLQYMALYELNGSQQPTPGLGSNNG